MLLFLWQTTFFFVLILVTGYLIPAGQFYYLYYVRRNVRTQQTRIQQRQPSHQDIEREVRQSLVTILIFAVLSACLLRAYRAGQTSIYWDLGRYPWYYHPISFLLFLLFHDTYFYWTHRLMHWPPVFKYVHLGHHKSLTPTPWAIFSFQPLEAVIQFGQIVLPVIYLPLHPVTLLLFLSYDSFINTAGHTGHEIFPQWLSRIWPFCWFNTVTHHDYHHTNVRVNYGAFFNVWDRMMGTFLDTAPEVRDAEWPSVRKPHSRPKTRC